MAGSLNASGDWRGMTIKTRRSHKFKAFETEKLIWHICHNQAECYPLLAKSFKPNGGY